VVRIYRIIQRKSQTPLYNIGVTSKLTGLPIWTLRWIEKHGLVSPQRTEGNQRLYSDEDIDTLQQICSLLEEHVNVQGIRVIMKMRIEYYSESSEPEDNDTEERSEKK